MAKRRERRKQTTAEEFVQSILSYFLFVLLALAIVFAAGWAAWHYAISRIPADIARVWAVLATLFWLPLSVVMYFFGAREVQGFMRGADAMTDRMMGHLARFQETNRKAANDMRSSESEPPAYVQGSSILEPRDGRGGRAEL